jgi:secreted Zn-dependent insulinase-like peptidase
MIQYLVLHVRVVSTLIFLYNKCYRQIQPPCTHKNFLFLVTFMKDFHEHMLFLGTEKYSNEDEYETFLNQYGGFSNAYTDMEDTNYFFSITTDSEECFASEEVKCTDALHGAMDRLAQFFIAPKFDRDMVDRELRAIDSEYRNGLTNDSWRNFQLLKLSANQTHPISKFGCGNYETLLSSGQDILLEKLCQFWQNYYQTYNLRLALVGHGSLDSLQSMVEDTFGQCRIRWDYRVWSSTTWYCTPHYSNHRNPYHQNYVCDPTTG